MHKGPQLKLTLLFGCNPIYSTTEGEKVKEESLLGETSTEKDKDKLNTTVIAPAPAYKVC